MRKVAIGGGMVGVGSAAASAAVLMYAPVLFTADAAVIAIIRSLVPFVAPCIGTLALMCAMEGVLLARRRLSFLSAFYTTNAVAMVAAFQIVEHMGLGLHAAWGCMLAFQLVRLAVFGRELWVRKA